MVLRMLRRAMTSLGRRPPPGVKSFAHELHLAGGLAGRADAGLQVVPTDRVIGSVDRWRELRADFTFATWPRLTERHRRIGRAMRAGATLPPLELYALSCRRPGRASRTGGSIMWSTAITGWRWPGGSGRTSSTHTSSSIAWRRVWRREAAAEAKSRGLARPAS